MLYNEKHYEMHEDNYQENDVVFITGNISKYVSIFSIYCIYLITHLKCVTLIKLIILFPVI